MIPICVVSKEWLDAQIKANFDLARAYMDGFEAGKRPLRKTPAGKMQIIQDLLDPTWEDEDGVVHHGEPLITKEQALALLQMEDSDE